MMTRALRAQGPRPARIVIDTSRRISDIDRRLWGSFLEHLGRAIYGGIYEPGSKLADANGHRKDVLEEVRTLGVPIVRYPGGNFVSGYHWPDGVGPKEKRPRVLDRAWNTVDSNQFGTNEFIAWCRAAGVEPLLAVNLGSGTPEMAAASVEYCNVDKGTRWSDLRRQHGIEAPHGVKYWCLGNEMDGPWQIGHMSAREYGRKAADAAHQMRVLDQDLKLIACGSSGPFMPTYLEWDREVLEECYNEVDALSLHRYFNNSTETDGDSTRFVALNLAMDRQIEEIAAICDVVRARKHSSKRLWLSFDEWNVWYRDRNHDGHRQEAPRLLEEIYNLEDALLVGGILNTLLRHSDRVRVACLAQLVNVIAPLMTTPDRVIRQTIYYPYAWALKYAHGSALNVYLEAETYEVPRLGRVPYLDVAATFDNDRKEAALFILNRDLSRPRDIEAYWHEAAPTRALASQVFTGNDLKATNTSERADRVRPQPFDPPRVGPRMSFQVPASSYTVLQFAMG